MKKYNLISILCVAFFGLFVASCKNESVSFPDYKFSTVYFAYQTPVRTIVLGEDTYDTSLDNAHKCEIYATMGGVYANKKSINIDFVVDNTLCDYLNFADGTPVKAMPSSYYSLASNKIALDHALQGAVGVQLTDAFFADLKSLTNTYVIPLKMTNVTNADSILLGKAKTSGAALTNLAAWDIQPKNYVLYCVKFINTWHGIYLRRGVDVVSTSTTPVIRHKQYVEYSDLISLSSLSLSDISFPLAITNADGTDVGFKFKLTFDQNSKCTAAPYSTSYQVNDSVRVYNVTTTGNGTFVKKGEKNSWGNTDRDGLYLKYNYGLVIESTHKNKPTVTQNIQVSTTDTLVARNRGVAIETFTPVYTK